MARLYENGMTRIEIIREYDSTLLNFSNWINTGSFNHQDNLISDDKCSCHFANITRYSQQNVEFKIKNVNIIVNKIKKSNKKDNSRAIRILNFRLLLFGNKSKIIETLTS